MQYTDDEDDTRCVCHHSIIIAIKTLRKTDFFKSAIIIWNNIKNKLNIYSQTSQ